MLKVSFDNKSIKTTISILILLFCIIPGMLTAQSTDIPGTEEADVKISTTEGDMLVVLFEKTPEHRENFLELAADGFYDGLLFHRVIRGFMVQAGDPHSRDAEPGEPLGRGGPGYTIPAEFHDDLIHRKGALSAARQGDQVNPEQRSSGSQFYIVQGRRWSEEDLDQMEEERNMSFSEEQREIYTTAGGTPHLDGTYTVFGQVVDGLEVIDRIAAAETDDRDRPQEDIRITNVEVID